MQIKDRITVLEVILKMTSEKRNLNSGTVALLFLGFGFLVVALGVGAYIHLEVMGELLMCPKSSHLFFDIYIIN